MGTGRAASFCLAAVVCALLAGCGGGGGAQSTPAPSPSPTPSTPTPALAPVNYNTAEYRSSSGLSQHGAISAYDAGASGAGIAVGIVDTGIDVDNPEFAGRISPASAALNGQGSIQDQEGHGTAVATVLAAARNDVRTMGMAWGATIMALRTEDVTNCPADTGCTHPGSYIAAAIDRARVNGAKVINLSLGGDGASSAVTAAIGRATASGIVVAVSAGNDSAASPDGFAAALANPSVSNGLVIIVTSNDADGSHSGFANGAQGYETVTLSALGDRVLAQDQNGTLTLWTGTSMSAPQVAGAVALMLDAFPNLTPQQVVSRLLSTARDAGAAGADGEFGMGILDLAAAFAPAGTTTLGGGGVPVSLTQNGTLSSPMGDASGAASAKLVAIDAMGRAYSLQVQRSLTLHAARAILAGFRDGTPRSLSFGDGTLTGTMRLASRNIPSFNRFGEQTGFGGAGRVSATLSMRLSPTTALSMALRARSDLTGEPTTAGFLAAQEAGDSFGIDAATETAVVLRHDLGGGWRLGLAGEEGRFGQDANTRSQDAAWLADADGYRYRLFSSRLGLMRGPVSIWLTGSLMTEPSTLLGARLAPFFEVGGSSTFFADARLRTRFSANWSLDLSARRGWTRADGGGSAELRTLAWSAGVARGGLFDDGDRLALRIAQPLRATGGGVDAFLPVSHDYVSGGDEWRMTRISLSPRGREIDAELDYSAPLAGGWVSLNGYWRREPGNIAWSSDDIGGAVRFSVGY